jgi:hypothetical protein
VPKITIRESYELISTLKLTDLKENSNFSGKTSLWFSLRNSLIENLLIYVFLSQIGRISYTKNIVWMCMYMCINMLLYTIDLIKINRKLFCYCTCTFVCNCTKYMKLYENECTHEMPLDMT